LLGRGQKVLEVFLESHQRFTNDWALLQTGSQQVETGDAVRAGLRAGFVQHFQGAFADVVAVQADSWPKGRRLLPESGLHGGIDGICG
jgi:hypothetical protein